MTVAPGLIHSSCSVESLVSGAGAIPEGLHESSATGTVSRNMATIAREPSAQVHAFSCGPGCAYAGTLACQSWLKWGSALKALWYPVAFYGGLQHLLNNSLAEGQCAGAVSHTPADRSHLAWAHG